MAGPLSLLGWQTIDEMIRAFADQEDNRYAATVHGFTPENSEHDGGAKYINDPDNGYRNKYKKMG